MPERDIEKAYSTAEFNIEHEREGDEEEIEFQIKWTRLTGDSHSIRSMRGALKGIRTDVVREEDRI